MERPSTMKPAIPSKDVADLLANYAPEVRNLALAARSFVLAIVPDITERVVFLFLTIMDGNRSEAPMASPESGSSRELLLDNSGVAAGEPSRSLHQRVSPGPPATLTHMRVTDPVMSKALDALSRYEIAGLRRQALYGDDSAAFLLGMAYETGHMVPQNCAK